jgi:hypothetical protein
MPKLYPPAPTFEPDVCSSLHPAIAVYPPSIV